MSQWQAQVSFNTNLSTSASSNYDFSVLLTPNKDLKGATVKLTDRNDDKVFYFADQVDLTANTTYIFWKSDMPGIDIAALQLVCDFGGCPENFEIEIANVVLKDHANDDGTVLPDPDAPEPVVFDWDYNSDANLWKAVDAGEVTFETWFSPSENWDGYGNQPVPEREGDVYTLVTLDPAGGDQWKGQFKIHTNLSASKDKKYNFYCLVDSDQDISQMTFKLTQSGGGAADNNYFFAERKDVEADVQYVYKAKGVSLSTADADKLTLVLDIAGTPANTTLKVSKIYFEEVSE